MDREELHELTAAYALDALDPVEAEAFERHLATCESCRAQVAEFEAAAGSLAHAAPPVAPSLELRARVLAAARLERANVVSLRPRWAIPAAAAAAVAACAAIGLGVWDVTLHDRLSSARAQAIAAVPVSGASGSVVVSSGGTAALVVSNLVAAPAGKTYEAWVIEGHAVYMAGLFRGGATTNIITLTHAVPVGSVVAVTVEPAGGSTAPTRKPFIVSQPV
jgi:anti-sigma-K factor RskA